MTEPAAKLPSSGHPVLLSSDQLKEAVLPAIVALLIAAVLGDVLILSYGASPGDVYRLLIEGTWGNAYGFGQVLYKTTTLAFTGLAVALGLRAGLFNIGAESQLAFGGFLAALAGLWLPASVPGIVSIPALLIAAAIGGGAVGAVPGWLKAKFGAHEVITTIMLNFIVLAFLNWIVSGHLHVTDTLHTPEIHSGGVPRLSSITSAFHGSAANLTIVVALLVLLAAWWFLFRTRQGFELRAVGLQPQAAEYGGVNVPRAWWTAMLLSGAVAGLGGANYVMGYKGYYEEGFAGGSGFLGIAVAIVGRNHPLGVLLAAFVFATISQGGLVVNAIVPKQIVDVLQAVVIIAVAASVPEVRRIVLQTATKAVSRQRTTATS